MKNGKLSLLVVISLILLAFGALTACSSGKPSELTAGAHAQFYVEERMKNNGADEYSVSMSFGSPSVDDIGDNSYKVESFVELENAAGMSGKRYYTCVVVYSQDGEEMDVEGFSWN